MDKSTLSQYGWVIIVIIIIAILLGFSGPFAMFVKDTVFNTTIALGNKIDIPGPEDAPTPQLECYIGKTKLEYVKATFNEDFTEVVITKNGEDSDGKMLDFKLRSTFEDYESWLPYASPMAVKAQTLQSATIEDGVVSIGACAFANCGQLQTIILPESLASLGSSSFKECAKLKTINIPDKIKEIPQYCFQNCSSLNNVSLPDDLTTLALYSFYSCTSLSNINMPANLKVIKPYAFHYTKIQEIVLPDGLTEIGSHAFMNCTNLKTISIPATVSKIDEGIFRRTYALETITVNSDNPNYISVDGVLYNTDKTLLLAYPAANTAVNYSLPSTVKRIGVGAFSGSYVKTLLPNEALEEIGSGAFEYSYIASLNIPKNLKTIESTAFFRTPYFKTIAVDSNNTNFKVIDDGLYSYDEKDFYCFPANSDRTTFVMSPLTTTIHNGAFSISNLTEVTISENVTIIPSYCFDKSKITTFNLPSNLLEIGSFAFAEKSDIVSIVIPASVKTISSSAFYSCKNFTTIYGKPETYAETYAKNMGYIFKDINS